MRSKTWLIVCVWLLATTLADAAEVVATVTAYNKAELTGAITSTMSVSFANTNHSKGQITSGNEAVLTLLNLPPCTISGIKLSMKSNAGSGAGEVHIYLANQEIASIPNDNFCDWPGVSGYSTEFVPVSFSGDWNSSSTCDLRVHIKASVNTLTLDKVTVSYLPVAPEPQVVTLSWLDEEGKRQTTEIKEKSAQSGIVLPQSEVLMPGEDWTFAGWAKQLITQIYTSEPEMWTAGQYFYPQMNTTLYAVYKQAPILSDVPQTTSFHTGEYAIASKGVYYYCLMTGEVTGQYMASSPTNIKQDNDGLYYITDGYVSPYQRYHIEFEEDSLIIKYAMSGAYIGHNATKLSDKKAKWTWGEYKNHSLELSFGREEKSSGETGRVLWLNADGIFEVINLLLGQDFEYLLLFDVSDVPTSAGNVRWTGSPFGEDAIETVSQPHSPRKVLRNGILYIEYNNAEYDVLGHKII